MDRNEMLRKAKECLDEAKKSSEYAVSGNNRASDEWRATQISGAHALNETAEVYLKLAVMLEVES